MTRSWFNAPVRLAILIAAALSATPATQAPHPLLAAADKAEAELRFGVAAAHLYQLVSESPRAAEVPAARLRLARLLALMGDVPAAMNQSQAATAGALTTLLARRLRAGPVYYGTPAALPVKGLPSLDEPTAIVFEPSGHFLLVDTGDKRGYQIRADAVTPIPPVDQLHAATLLPDGRLLTSGKIGPAAGGAPLPLAGTWRGRARQVRKVRSVSAAGDGELLLIEDDFDGILRCRIATASCAPFGLPMKARIVRAGASGFVYVLEEDRKVVRVLDPTGKQIASAGPMIGSGQLKEVIDMAVDGAHGLYLLDKETKRIEVLVLRWPDGGQPSLVHLSGVTWRPDGSLRNPSALGIAPDGSAIVAGRGDARLMRLQ